MLFVATAAGQLSSVDLRSGCNDDHLHSCQGAQVRVFFPCLFLVETVS